MDGIKAQNRFAQFIAMIEDEVLGDTYAWLYKHEQKELSEYMKRPYMKSILKLLIIKILMNINEKEGLEKQFVNGLLGEVKTK